MNKQALATALLAVLLSAALAETSLINTVTANPISWGTKVVLLSPENKTYTQNTISITFQYDQQMKCNPYYKYILDGNESALLLAEFDGTENHAKITDLSDGVHTLIIHVMANAGSPPPGTWSLDWYSGYSSAVTFSIDATPPSIELLSPVDNNQYNVSDVPLIFTVNKPISSAAYSLNYTAQVTVDGNTTISLPDGAYSMRIYATDATGKTGKSQTVTFTVAQTQTSTSTGTFIVAAASVLVVAFAISLLLFFSRRCKSKV